MIYRFITICALALAGASARADAPHYAWVSVPFVETHCAEVNERGREIARADWSRCPTDGLVYRWRYVVHGFRCALESTTDKFFHVMVDDAKCGIPEHAYYRWQKTGLGENDWTCAMRVEGNDVFIVYAPAERCPAK